MYPLLAFVLSLAFYLAFNAHVPITDPVESNYALTAKEMLLSGDWLSPCIYGHYWYDKPAMIYWLIAAAYKLFGIGEFAARLPAAVASAASVAFTGWFTNRLYGSRLAGMLAALVLGTSLEFWVLAHMVITDAVLFLFSSVALGTFYLGLSGHGRGWFFPAYGFAGLAVLTKGPVGIVLPAIIIAGYIILTRRWRLLGNLFLLPGLAVFLAVAVPWYYAMYNVHGHAFTDTFLGLHNYLRATVSEHPRDNVFYYYLVLFPVSLLPWTGLLLRTFTRRRVPHFPYLAVWLGVTIIFYTLMATKYPTYVFPAAFPAAVLIGRELEQMRYSRARSWLWLSGPALVFFGLVAAGVIFWTAASWISLYVLIAAGAGMILWLQLRGGGLPLVGTVGLTAVALSLVLISQGLIPLAQDRSAKEVARALPSTAASVGAYGDYPTSAVFYSGYTIPELTIDSNNGGSTDVWAGKYTMPTEDAAKFAARTAGNPETYLIVKGDRKLPVSNFRLVAKYHNYSLYKRDMGQ